ncbi:MAG: phosphoribosylanthranilate isomerase [Oscillospiraceae bacterium]|nr:phosphoribosylanthranilate isomerase [Oscillospiraceae bacterium]
MSKVKICGLTRPEDIDAVNRVLPDYVGFVFAPSRRRIDEKMAAALKARLNSRIQAVGVFVNGDADIVEHLYRGGVIDLAQLHGDEDEAYIARLKDRCGCPVIKAGGVGKTLPPLPENADYWLFDTLSVRRGGTGRAFDWGLLKGFNGPPYFLAGGLTAQNAAEAVRTLSPYCADVSSGAETDGVKDAEKIEAFVRLVRGEKKDGSR